MYSLPIRECEIPQKPPNSFCLSKVGKGLGRFAATLSILWRQSHYVFLFFIFLESSFMIIRYSHYVFLIFIFLESSFMRIRYSRKNKTDLEVQKVMQSMSNNINTVGCHDVA